MSAFYVAGGGVMAQHPLQQRTLARLLAMGIAKIASPLNTTVRRKRRGGIMDAGHVIAAIMFISAFVVFCIFVIGLSVDRPWDDR